jgi:hypothetical protein
MVCCYHTRVGNIVVVNTQITKFYKHNNRSLGKMPLNEQGTGGPKPSHPYSGPNYRLEAAANGVNIDEMECDEVIHSLVSTIEQQQEQQQEQQTPQVQQQQQQQIQQQEQQQQQPQAQQQQQQLQSSLPQQSIENNNHQMVDIDTETIVNVVTNSPQQQKHSSSERRLSKPTIQPAMLLSLTPTINGGTTSTDAESRPKKKVKNRRKICSNCGVIKTPVWRKGPLGTGTLCNACGLKFSLGTILLDPETGAVPGKPGHLEFIPGSSDDEDGAAATTLVNDSGIAVTTPKSTRGRGRRRSSSSRTPRGSRGRRKSSELTHRHQLIAASASIMDVSGTSSSPIELCAHTTTAPTVTEEYTVEQPASNKRKIVEEAGNESKRRKSDQNLYLMKQTIWKSLIHSIGSFEIPYEGPCINDVITSETLLYILMFIDDPVTLCDTMSVCKLWNLVVRDQRVWRHLYSKTWSIDNRYVSTVLKRGEQIDWFKLFQARFNIYALANSNEQVEYMFKFYYIEGNANILPCIMDTLQKEYFKKRKETVHEQQQQNGIHHDLVIHGE